MTFVPERGETKDSISQPIRMTHKSLMQTEILDSFQASKGRPTERGNLFLGTRYKWKFPRTEQQL